MSRLGSSTGHGSLSDTAFGAWADRVADDVPPGWMDNAMRRLFDLWNVQMIKLEQPGKDTRKAAERAQDVRTLAQLQRALIELVKLETMRAAVRSVKRSDNDEEGAAEFDRRLLGHLKAAGAPDISEEIDE